ncbi:hypothetical protein BDM02DRAFT_3185966 [Thelephora ganbajun]|uniref:Uncharacterized protein n=1 Tax=Thelephora ganbajun TaxID=370292 RepID=A0ACB6ZKB6_THEGA|nr:hypothetical protein BDM02DRAFT_3185966 [Thelephora ganbajun]
MLKVDEARRTIKTAHLDRLSAVLQPAWQMRPGTATYHVHPRDQKLYICLGDKSIDGSLLAEPKRAPPVLAYFLRKSGAFTKLGAPSSLSLPPSRDSRPP